MPAPRAAAGAPGRFSDFVAPSLRTGLVPILRRPARTELLINFNARYALRLAGHLDSDAAAAPAKVELLTRALGTDRWKEWSHPGETGAAQLDPAPLGERIADIYMQQIRDHSFSYVNRYPVRSVVDGHVKYYLIFATRHAKGMWP